MKISYPYNLTKTANGQVKEETIAFPSSSGTQAYQQEVLECRKLQVPRAKLGDADFKQLVNAWSPMLKGGIKWVYTVYRELYVIPASFKRHEPPHSYAAGNSPVFTAGFADQGESVNQLNINNWSGHYKPSNASLQHHIAASWGKSDYQITIV